MTVMVAVAAMIALVFLIGLGRQPVCLLCGGRGKHRPDCPENK